MKLEKGKSYRVRGDHPFHPGRIGKFEFMGGPDYDCVVLSEVPKNVYLSHTKTYFAVGLNDIMGD